VRFKPNELPIKIKYNLQPKQKSYCSLKTGLSFVSLSNFWIATNTTKTVNLS